MISSLPTNMHIHWLRQEILANDLANASTAGFKRDGLSIAGQPVPPAEPTFAMLGMTPNDHYTVTQWTDYSPGVDPRHRSAPRHRDRRARLLRGADAARAALHARGRPHGGPRRLADDGGRLPDHGRRRADRGDVDAPQLRVARARSRTTARSSTRSASSTSRGPIGCRRKAMASSCPSAPPRRPPPRPTTRSSAERSRAPTPTRCAPWSR